MSTRLWPFGRRTAIALLPLIFVGLLIGVAILREIAGWPGSDSDTVVFLAIVALSFTPIALMVVDGVAEGGGTIEVSRLGKIDFSSSVQTAEVIPANIELTPSPGTTIADSGSSAILDGLRRATGDDIVTLNLKGGDAWWETRLLVLCAGAVRLGRPKAIVFIADEGGDSGRFIGWSEPDKLLDALIRADDRYRQSYLEAQTAAKQWELVPPPAPANDALPTAFPWMTGLATKHAWIAYDGNQPNEMVFEQFLAASVGEHEPPPRGISTLRLRDLFSSILVDRYLDRTLSEEKQVEAVLDNRHAYIAVVEDKRYVGLLSRDSGQQALLRGLVERGERRSTTG